MARDLTKGKPLKGILLFSLPIMAGLLLQQLYSTVDSIVVGNSIGEAALAAVGTCAPLTFFFVAFAMGLANGAGVVFSQYYGAKRMESLRTAFSTAAILLFGIGIVMTAVGLLLGRGILGTTLKVPPEILDEAVGYFSIYCMGLVFQFVYNAVSAALRAVGDSVATLIFLCISSVLNIALDLLFVLEFRWGVRGTAIATIISQAVSAIVSIIYMQKKYDFYRFKKGEFGFNGQMCKLTLKFGVPTMIQMCIVSGGQVVIQRVANDLGASAIAAATAAGRIENYIFIPSQSFNNGMAMYTGQNVGAGNIPRVYEGMKKTLLLSVPICIVLMVVSIFLAGPLVGLFGVEGEALTLGIKHLRFIAPFYIFFAVYMPMVAVLTGSGDVYFSTGITLSGLAIRVLATYVFAYALHCGFASLYYSVPIGWLLLLALAFFRFMSGKWQTKRVVKGGPPAQPAEGPAPDEEINEEN
ncbi:MAG: MATE family efflux transporter [Oscillospiraceae bacterium]|nr:MATE family efflux transporter [Oscillospiraceae bacterium]